MQNDEFKDVGKGITFGYNADKAMYINPKPPKKFEYKVMEYKVSSNSVIEKILNEEGQQDWELVSIEREFKYSESLATFTAYFKREKITPCY